MSLAPSEELLEQYQLLSGGGGFVALGSGSSVTLRGADRRNFLNGFCTNDVMRLSPESWCEAFITNVQGKTLGHVLVTCREEEIVLVTVPGQAEKLLAHLDHYLIREQVELEDTTAQRSYMLVSGAADTEAINRFLQMIGADAPARADDPTQRRLLSGGLEGVTICVVVNDLLGSVPSYLVEHRPDDFGLLQQALSECGLQQCSKESLDSLRLEAGLPLWGVDFDDSNLPQEIGRGERAISLTKGCYLGQETVARIDALGHVNRRLAGVHFPAGSEIAVGAQLTSEGKVVGQVTSIAYSPRLALPLALALVRRGFQEPGTRLATSQGIGEVASLPLD